MKSEITGITRANEGMQGISWNILGQTYVPKSCTEHSFSWHATLPPGPARPMRVEHEYFRTGALTYLAAWDVHRAKLFGRCEPKTTIGAVDRLVAQVMTTEPYRSARRVFWIADNCSSHRATERPTASAHGGRR